MSIFRSKRLEQELEVVRERGEQTAEELSRVKLRQENIEKRLKFLQQELQVQQRTSE